MKITTQPNLTAEKLKIVVGDGGFGTVYLNLVVVNLQDGTYLITLDEADSNTVTVHKLEKQPVRTELNNLLESNIALKDFTSEQLDEIADTISKLNL